GLHTEQRHALAKRLMLSYHFPDCAIGFVLHAITARWRTVGNNPFVASEGRFVPGIFLGECQEFGCKVVEEFRCTALEFFSLRIRREALETSLSSAGALLINDFEVSKSNGGDRGGVISLCLGQSTDQACQNR